MEQLDAHGHRNTNRFASQVAIVTGGADGIGKGIGTRLAAEGARVILFDINRVLLERTVAECSARGYAVTGQVVDIGVEASVEAAIQAVLETTGRLDIMVNSAGIVGPTNTKITDYSVTDFDSVYTVNLRGAFLMTKWAVKAMEANRYGRILHIASIAGKEGNPFMAGYSSMKAGLIGLVKGVAKEYAEAGITVNGLAPAVIKTAMNEHTAPEQLAYMTAKIPMKRLGTIDEVASLAAWIVSGESSFTTGFIFDLSGGRATY
ncbi:SDR family NAD(P)-dependent oxidoreductase [Spirosoma utsteinense]|uniref:3-oxoacyl-[acyl-carrier protein] reductase n=1 Tax=Spirosoma utsteinense TaxID=2585773 RepID=A0ABR6WD78_9BACT|nr:SDR family NAD(P)-dependent oxidoreductase [Spirosoma utsteinense]MBC3788757.1 3-oxoacyl-[acyl-carrier protein] reductase [Spirosoma utsteinense]MBC3794512.1 3-oxoacyl-[acyl-carrier protein] reductase [Spirosoma utsteinense]